MDSWCLPGWLWWCAGVVSRCVGTAVVVRRWLAPWMYWLGRHALCWCRYTWSSHRRCRHRLPRHHVAGPDSVRHRSSPSTCPCCDGVDFDSMAGAWAVVTGCTDGIGKEYALQLTDRGLNVALVSRNKVKLQAVAQEIHERHGGRIGTRIVTADLTSSGGTVSLAYTYDVVRRGLAGLDVKLLVNNAGLGYGRPERLLDLPPCCSGSGAGSDPCRDVVECNALAAVTMCRIVMPMMLDSHDRRDGDDDEGDDSNQAHDRDDDDRPMLWPSAPPPSPASSTAPTSPWTLSTVRGGVVINVSSASALLPCPLLSVYAATKAFLDKFSAELAVEYGKMISGKQPIIAVRCLTPGFVATKLSRIRAGIKGDTGWTFAPGPGSYARYSLRSLGCHCACRKLRGLRKNQKHRGAGNSKSGGNGGKEAGHGWLAGVISAVFVSPSSPFSVGLTGVATTGYPSHEIMVTAVNAARWLVGDAYVYDTVSGIMCRARDRIARRDANKSKKATSTAAAPKIGEKQ